MSDENDEDLFTHFEAQLGSTSDDSAVGLALAGLIVVLILILIACSPAIVIGVWRWAL